MRDLAASLQALLAGTYTIQRELGGGGMSRVFLATDSTLGRDVVIKVLSSESPTSVSVDRFRREIRLIAALQHPHIVPVLSAGAVNDLPYYIMPFVRGESLRERFTRNGALPIADAIRLLRDMLDALAFAHEHGVVHRDVKPENILIEAGHAIVADFGIAKAVRDSGTLTSAGVSLGTPAYMAPEQAAADPAVDHRADLYAAGVVAYEMLAGKAPFSGSAQQIITAHFTTPAPSLNTSRPDLPPTLADLIARALEKDPARRPQSAREMIAELDALNRSGSSNRIERGEPSSVRKSRRVMAIGLAVLVVGGGAATVAWRLRSSAPTVTGGAEIIAVMPLSATSDSALTRLGQDMVITLSATLDGVGPLRTTDAATVLTRARTLPSPLPVTDAQAAAKALGARSVLTGTLVPEGDRVRATVTLRHVDGDSTLAGASALAAAKDIAALTDTLTWQILRQVWQRGTAPSPMLAGIATPSIDALRAFLDGEREFGKNNFVAAFAAFSRASEADSNFAQAYLRHVETARWLLQPDSAAWRRLRVLASRLPPRDRAWVDVEGSGRSISEKANQWRDVNAKFPDAPLILASAGDLIVHYGPLVGIPLSDATPYFERLDQLTPGHGDVQSHLGFLAWLATPAHDPVAAARWLRLSARGGTEIVGNAYLFFATILDRQATGKPFTANDADFRVMQATVGATTGLPNANAALFATAPGYMFGRPRFDLDLLARVRQAGLVRGELAVAASFGEANQHAATGDWGTAVARAGPLESLDASPVFARLTAARIATIGTWLGALPIAVADSALHRAASLKLSPTNDDERTELPWLMGLGAIVRGDSAAMVVAGRMLRADTTHAAQLAARSLLGLWLDHQHVAAGADTLMAVCDDAMRTGRQDGGFSLASEAVDRLVVARALRRRGKPAAAERYLMWTDAVLLEQPRGAVRLPLASIVEYERGVSLQEAGDRAGALARLRRFLDHYDQPPAAHRGLIEDAQGRIRELESPDAKAMKQVPQR